MSRVPNTSKAEEFQVHAEGGPFAFRIVRIDDYTSKNNETGFPDKFKMSLDAIGNQEGHCNITIFPAKSERSYMLRMICKAVGLSDEGGFDSSEFIGKTFQANVANNEYQGKTYANLDAKTIAPYEGDDEELPF
jgi:hypothetical protein